MITISNPKVTGFSPRWRTFRGFTTLFDNPGNSLAAWRDYELVACNVMDDPALDFYRMLRAGLEEFGIDLLTETYLFCPLDPASYHVTAWDCVNDGHMTQINAPQQPALAQVLDALPTSLATPNAFTEFPLASPLLTKQDWAIRFRFDRIFKWSNIALVTQLRPADDEAARELQTFTAARDQLNQEFRQTFGISASKVYVPHVTLGYFANQQAAQLATPCVDEWSAHLAARVGDLTLTFNRASLYGFTDMETFFRNPQ